MAYKTILGRAKIFDKCQQIHFVFCYKKNKFFCKGGGLYAPLLPLIAPLRLIVLGTYKEGGGRWRCLDALVHHRSSFMGANYVA